MSTNYWMGFQLLQGEIIGIGDFFNGGWSSATSSSSWPIPWGSQSMFRRRDGARWGWTCRARPASRLHCLMRTRMMNSWTGWRVPSCGGPSRAGWSGRGLWIRPQVPRSSCAKRKPNNNKIIIRIDSSITIGITTILSSLTKRQFKLLVDLDCSDSTICHNFIKCRNHHDPTVLEISPT